MHMLDHAYCRRMTATKRIKESSRGQSGTEFWSGSWSSAVLEFEYRELPSMTGQDRQERNLA